MAVDAPKYDKDKHQQAMQYSQDVQNGFLAHKEAQEPLEPVSGHPTTPDLETALRGLKSARGYLLNAQIDLETGAPKTTAIMTIKGGIQMIDNILERNKA